VTRARALGVWWIAVAAGTVATSCHRGGSGEPGSCIEVEGNVCTEYSAATARGGRRTCAGSWRAGAASCPTEELLGTCAQPGGNVVEHRYGGAPNHYTAAGARRSCETAGGTWRDR
jgi:hypothetical protein